MNTTPENLENYFEKFWESSNFKKIISENVEKYYGMFENITEIFENYFENFPKKMSENFENY